MRQTSRDRFATVASQERKATRMLDEPKPITPEELAKKKIRAVRFLCKSQRPVGYAIEFAKDLLLAIAEVERLGRLVRARHWAMARLSHKGRVLGHEGGQSCSLHGCYLSCWEDWLDANAPGFEEGESGT
jgi:hypothetical protein